MIGFLYRCIEVFLLKLCTFLDRCYQQDTLFKKGLVILILCIGIFMLTYAILTGSNIIREFLKQPITLKHVLASLSMTYDRTKSGMLFLIASLFGLLYILRFLVNEQDENFTTDIVILVNLNREHNEDQNGGQNGEGGGQNGGEGDLPRNDTQNVHDSSITQYCNLSIRKLKTEDIISSGEVIAAYAEIRAYLLDVVHDKASNALFVLEYMNRLNGLHIGSNLREMEILFLVWKRMMHPINHAVRKELQESLLVQLNDCLEIQNNPTAVLCETGRISRILQSLQCIDVENIVDIKPLWAIKEEIGTLVLKYSDKLLEKAPIPYQEAFKNLDRTSEQLTLMTHFNHCLELNLQKKLKRLYLDTQILTSRQLKLLADPYLNDLNNLF